MKIEFRLPSDELSGGVPNFDLAADYLELRAIFSKHARSLTSDLIHVMETNAENDYADIDEELSKREVIASGTTAKIDERRDALGCAYPFEMDDDGKELSYAGLELSIGQAAYSLSLILSNLKAVSPILEDSSIHPSDNEIDDIRRYFQYFATAALAAEVNGRSWSFGYPRPDGTGFHEKLTEIWNVLRDGVLQTAPSAPKRRNDDGIDVFAASPHRDKLPGFLLAAAQVATGKNWREKSLRNHIENVFPRRWFGQRPVSQMLCYHIIPFTIPDDIFPDACSEFGNILHRLRVPRRVSEAEMLHDRDGHVETFDKLPDAVEWIKAYVGKHRSPDERKS